MPRQLTDREWIEDTRRRLSGTMPADELLKFIDTRLTEACNRLEASVKARERIEEVAREELDYERCECCSVVSEVTWVGEDHVPLCTECLEGLESESEGEEVPS